MTNKVSTWVLIMALLISQSYAYAFSPCESNAHASTLHIDDMGSQHLSPQSLDPQSLDLNIHSQLEAEMTIHMQHNMEQNTQQDTQQDMAMDCCDQECSCLTGTCASVTFTQFITVTAVNAVSDSSGFYLFSIQDAFLPSLRRPPIIG
jgi:hypothetical protein